MVNNFELILPFCPPTFDGDTFIYTELLNRGKKKGNNGHRIVKTFYHRSQAEFLDQWIEIQKLCDLVKVRACTRLAPRSYKKVGRTFTELVVRTAMCENWSGMKSLYNHACGTTGPNKRLWLFDVDVINPNTLKLGEQLRELGYLVQTIPSRKGLHYITEPFFVEKELGVLPADVGIHKDNPTNLYIPDGAD